MSLEQLTTIESIKQFQEGTQAVAFSMAIDKQARYRWVQKALESPSSFLSSSLVR